MQFRQSKTLTADDELKTKEICSKFKVDKPVAELLLMRGLTDYEQINDFLNPSFSQFNDPFLFNDMENIVKRIRLAIEQKQRILIFGDYDVDGITSTYILFDYFRSQGQKVETFLPNRYFDGYGLTKASIDKVIDQFNPELIITVDCGITGCDEVEYIKSKGIDVIITDHHECDEELPKCLILDAKCPNEKYPFKELCGAGVAFKLVEALEGLDFAKKYLSVTAIATVSDIVPLVNENRAIVALGLDMGVDSLPVGIRQLIKELKIKDNKLTSQDISFKIAPKLNASGRMGDANHSLQLYLETNKTRIAEMIKQLLDYNLERQELCNIVYSDCVKELKNINLANQKVIVLYGDNWNIGILGIVAARIVEEYNRPAFLLGKEGEYYKGSCRSVDNMDVHSVLSQMGDDILASFGGHTMAGGMSVPCSKIKEFKERLIDIVEKMYPFDFFVPTYDYDLEIDVSKIDSSFIKSFEVLEPFGCQNPTPRFCVDFDKSVVSTMKNNSAHITIQLPNITLLLFNGATQFNLISQSSKKKAIIELQIDEFRGVKSNKGVVKQIILDSIPNIGVERIGGEYLKQLALTSNGHKPVFETYKRENINELLQSFGDSKYGTLIIANTLQGYKDFVSNNTFKENLICYDYLNLSNVNGYNAICMCPSLDNDFSNFNNIVLLDGVLDESYIIYLNSKTKAKIFIPQNIPFIYAPFQFIDISRKTFGLYFNIFKNAVKNGVVAFDDFNYYNKLKKLDKNINYVEFVATLETFKELNLIKDNVELGNYYLTITGVKGTQLSDSKFYNKLELVIKTY